MRSYIKILSELTKIRITLFVAITTFFGFLCKAETINASIILPLIGLFILACGSAALNHVQEYKLDSLMERTIKRPIPSGRIKPKQALYFALILVTVGGALLYMGAGFVALILGILNLIWYNLIYTPLKKRTAFAIVPGSMVGAIPPAVGWVSAGGSLLDPRIIAISFFFFIWQIPHFWLLLLMLNKDYEKAGFPVLTNIFNRSQLSRITFVWISSTAASALLLPVFGIFKMNIAVLLVILLGIWLTYRASLLLRGEETKVTYLAAFKEINIFALMVILILTIDKLINF